MEIEAGDYIRDKYGEIHKVYKIKENTIYCDKPNWENLPFDTFGCRYYEDKSGIVKHSKNIIDLIGVGDIVETFDVLNNDIIYIWSEEMLKALKEDIENGIQIKSIVTKELFASVEYKVGEG